MVKKLTGQARKAERLASFAAEHEQEHTVLGPDALHAHGLETNTACHSNIPEGNRSAVQAIQFSRLEAVSHFLHRYQAFSTSLTTRSATHRLCLCVWRCPLLPVRNMEFPIAMATRSSEIFSIFDFDSDLSEPPSDLEDMDHSIRDGLEQMDLDGPTLKRKSTATTTSEDSSMIDLSSEHTSHPDRAKRQRLSYQSMVRIGDFPQEVSRAISSRRSILIVVDS